MNWISFDIKKPLQKDGILQRLVSLEKKVSVFYRKLCLWQEEHPWFLKLWQFLF